MKCTESLPLPPVLILGSNHVPLRALVDKLCLALHFSRYGHHAYKSLIGGCVGQRLWCIPAVCSLHALGWSPGLVHDSRYRQRDREVLLDVKDVSATVG